MPEETKLTDDIQSLDDLIKIEGVENVPLQEIMIPFSGQWNPTLDPSQLGPENFQSLINMRYTDAGIEGVNGYVVKQSNSIATYTNIKNGIHFETEGRLTENYQLLHAVSSGGQGRVYINKIDDNTPENYATSIGEQASGSKPDYLWEDSSTGLQGRFSKAPGENIAYANGEEVFIWSGEESNPLSIFTTTDSNESDPVDVTEKLTNSRTDSDNVVVLDTADREHLTILTNRPIQAITFYVQSANVSASTLSVDYWGNSSYYGTTNGSDGTSSGGVALAQNGTYTFDSTTSNAELHHFESRYLYSYQVALSAGTATLSQITVDIPPQAPTNIWDGVYRTPIQCQYYDQSATTYEDYTLHVVESSTVGTPVGAIMDGMTTSDYLYLMFDERMAGINIIMLGNLVNTNSAAISIEYWDGDSWSGLSETDNTSGLSTSGTITWRPPTDEEKTTLFGTQGYAYRLSTSATLSDTTAGKAVEDVVIDLLNGIPAIEKIETFKFPVQYKNKLFLCNAAEKNEGNRIDYSVDNAPDVFNGESSSLNGYQSIYVGGSEHLTAACQLYNRFGSNLFTSLAIFKENELYLLTGDSPIDYRLFPVSFKIGCPAPKTLATAEVGFELGEDVSRNVAMFISNSGPMMYDGAMLYPMRGMEKYFDPNESNDVNWAYLDQAVGWFDTKNKEYNCILPTGSSTTPNTWLVYDVVRKRWFSKDYGAADAILSGWNVTSTGGQQLVYAGTDNGTFVDLENGTAWDDVAIVNTVHTADIFPANNQWDITRIRRLRFICKRTDEADTNVTFTHYVNTNTSGSSDTLDISTSGNYRLARVTEPLNTTGWSHSFKFVFSSDSVEKGMQPIAWGVQFDVARKDY